MKFPNWNIHGYNRPTAVALSRSGFNPLVSVYLTCRGITTAEDANKMLSDDLDSIHDPYLLKDMDIAVARIRRAIDNNEKIAVYGDYDVDGMTSSCLVASFLRANGIDYDIYIPGRMDEGYGVNTAALDLLKSNGVSLVITVDCGITALKETAYAKELGIDLIITDHHECKCELPAAVAVINPKRRDCPYPNKSLAGVGVAFKLICALEADRGIDQLLTTYGDLVAIGTIADVMCVVGENRTLIKRGLAALNKKRRPGLRQLMRESCVERRDINTASIGFIISPRLNAAGRMGKTSLTINLLLTEDDEEATQLTQELNGLNLERRQLEAGIFEEAFSAIEQNPPQGPVVLASRGWHQGVMGIVAAKVAEQFFLPSIMISVDEDGVGRGSCRSFGNYPIYTALEKCSDLLENFGGHEMAAGLTILECNIDAFRQRIFDDYQKVVDSPTSRVLHIDFEVIKPELLSLDNLSALERTEPFGHGFLPPFLCMKSVFLQSLVSIGGGKHAKLRVVKGGKYFDCIWFNMPAEELGVTEGTHIDIAFEPVVNEYRGWRNVQLHIIDIRTHAE